MNYIVDTNVLLRASIRDDEEQAKIADHILRSSPRLVVTLPSLCEFVWVLRSRYKVDRQSIAQSIERLCDAPNVKTNREAVRSGLVVLRSGGDFADGVIAYEGEWLGGEVFVSFDQKAIEILNKNGKTAKLLA